MLSRRDLTETRREDLRDNDSGKASRLDENDS